MSEDRFRFGGPESRGVAAGLRGGQLAVLAVSALLALAILRRWPDTVGLAVAVTLLGVGATAAFVHVGGRGVDEWAPVLAGWASRRVSGADRWRSSQIGRGRRPGGVAPVAAPPGLEGVSLLGVDVGDERELGVFRDRVARTYTAVLDVRPSSLALADSAERRRRLDGWARVLAALARPSCRVRRIQWVERTLPDDGDEIGRYLREELALAPSATSVLSYLDLVDAAGPAQQRHKTHLAVQVAAVGGRRGAERDHASCAALLDEVRGLVSHLGDAGVPVAGALSPRLLALALRSAFDPATGAAFSRRAASGGGDGCSPDVAWPVAVEEAWGSLRTDGAAHATYWIQEWPRTEVDADFLAPLLLTTQCVRTIAVVMEPVSSSRALREVERRQTGDDAEDALRNRWGFRVGSRRRLERERVTGREEELAAGHADVRFSGYVTVTGSGPDELERACGEVERGAQQAHLELRRLHGDQQSAFACTLPLCRGLR